MSDVADRYRRLSGAFAEKVAEVRDWTAPTPCEGWTARDLVEHVVETHGVFLRLVDRAAPPAVEDPVAAFAAARDAVQRDLDDPERASATFDGVMGRQTFAGAIDRFICFDLVVHGWDLARAAGLDERIDPSELDRLHESAAAFGEALRSPNVCGPALDPPAGADQQTEVLAFLGRRAW